MKRKHYYALGLIAVAALLLVSVLMNPNSDFSGTDDSGGEVIEEVDPDYRPWFQSLWEPSPELETLFFTLQAAIGALIIGYFLGANKVRKQKQGEG